MSRLYLRATERLGWLLTSVEAALEESPDGLPITIGFVQATSGERLASYDEADVCRAALEDLGILRRSTTEWQLDRQRLAATKGYREGVRDGLHHAASGPVDTTVVCVATPPGLPQETEESLRREAVDLRTALFDLLAGAQHRIVIGCPFWDTQTAQDVASILSRRLEAGVRVDVLSRSDGTEDPAVGLLEALARESKALRLFSLYEPDEADPFGVRTFHFKAIVADGERAYLGTANLTTAGLRSRLELGVLLTGAPARTVSRVLDIVLRLARPSQPGERRTKQ